MKKIKTGKFIEIKYKLKIMMFYSLTRLFNRKYIFLTNFVTNDIESLVNIGNHWYLFLVKINFYNVKITFESKLHEIIKIFVPMILVIESLLP